VSGVGLKKEVADAIGIKEDHKQKTQMASLISWSWATSRSPILPEPFSLLTLRITTGERSSMEVWEFKSSASSIVTST